MTVIVFVGWIVSVNVLLFLWYRRSRRKRHVEQLQRILQDVTRREPHRFNLSPRDVAELRELVDDAHRRNPQDSDPPSIENGNRRANEFLAEL